MFQGNEILTGSWTQSDALQLWNFSEGELIKNIPFNEGEKGAYLYAAQFCENDVVLAGGSGTKSVQAINIKTSQVSLIYYAFLHVLLQLGPIFETLSHCHSHL